MQSIPLTDLLLDPENPRFDEAASQNDAIVRMALEQGDKLVKLAKHIVEHGLNPAERPIVIATSGDRNLYVVLEGNRRIAALKILSTPEILSGGQSPSLAEKFRKLSQQFNQSSIAEVECVVATSREEADIWIELRHTGQNEGAGVVGWTGKESARYNELRGKSKPALQVLNYVREHGALSTEAIELLPKIAITNLQRLVEDPAVRESVGIDVKDKQVIFTHTDDAVRQVLSRIVEDLATKKIKVSDIDTKEDRKKYIESFGPELLPSPTTVAEPHFPNGTKVESSKEAKTEKKVSKTKRKAATQRSTVIPRSCNLEVPTPRINRIYLELKALSADQFTNAASVLMRVFFELSADDYIGRTPAIKLKENKSSLKDKLWAIVRHMRDNNMMTRHQLDAVERIYSGHHFLAGSASSMNGFVHNPYFSPSSTELKTGWDDLQSFVELLWK